MISVQDELNDLDLRYYLIILNATTSASLVLKKKFVGLQLFMVPIKPIIILSGPSRLVFSIVDLCGSNYLINQLLTLLSESRSIRNNQ